MNKRTRRRASTMLRLAAPNIGTAAGGAMHDLTAPARLTVLALLLAVMWGWVTPAQGLVSPAVSAGYYHTVGLRWTGSVVATGDNSYGQCNVSDWRGITAIDAGAFYTVALTEEGSVVATGDNSYGQCDVGGWTEIKAVSAGGHHTVALRADGSVVATGDNSYGQCDVGGWTDIKAVSAGMWHTVGVRFDGSVVAVGYNESRQCDVGGWSNVDSVAAGTSHSVALKSDGSCEATGSTGDDEVPVLQCNVGGWSGITAIAAGRWHTIGMKSDGTAVAVGYSGEDLSYNGTCDVGGWRNLIAVAAGDELSVGLRSDGTVVARGMNDRGQCNVGAWRLKGSTAMSLVASSVHPPYGQAFKLAGIVWNPGASGVVTTTVAFDRVTASAWSTVTVSGGYGSAFCAIGGLRTAQTYRARFLGNTWFRASTSPAVRVTPLARLTRTTSWTTLLRYRTYQASGYIEPYHSTSDGNPILIRAYKQDTNGTYRYVRSFAARYTYYSATKTRYLAAVKFGISGKGSWKLVAYHRADSRNYKTYGAPDYFIVR